MVAVSNLVVEVLVAYSVRNFAMAVVASIRVVEEWEVTVVVAASAAKAAVESMTMVESAVLLVPT